MGLRIVIVNQVPTRPLLEAAGALADRGHDVTVVAAASRLPDEIRGVQMVRLGDYDRRTTFTRLRSWALFSARAACVLLRLPASAVVVVCTNPPLMPYVAALASTLRGWRCVFRILDVYPDVLRAVGYTPSSLVYRCLAWWNRWSYARCTAICTLGDTMADTLAAYAPRSRINVIPEWVEAIPGDSSPDLKPSTDPFVVLAAGNVGLTHDIGPLVAACRLLAAENVEFVISTDNVPAMSDAFSGCPRARVVPRFDDRDYVAAIHTAGVAFICLKTGAANACFPSRTLTYLARGLPVIAVTTQPSDLAATVAKGPCGQVVRPERAGTEVADAIRQLMHSPDLRLAMRDASIALANSDFNPNLCRQQLVLTIEAAGRGFAGDAISPPQSKPAGGLVKS